MVPWRDVLWGYMELQAQEAQKHLGWNRLLKALSPAVNPGLPSPPLNHDLKCCIYMSVKCSQGWCTTSLGSLFQLMSAASVKEFFLILNVNLSWCDLRSLALVLSLVTGEKRPTPTFHQLPCPLAPAPLSSSGLSPATSVPFFQREPRTEHRMQRVASQCWVQSTALVLLATLPGSGQDAKGLCVRLLSMRQNYEFFVTLLKN